MPDENDRPHSSTPQYKRKLLLALALVVIAVIAVLVTLFLIM